MARGLIQRPAGESQKEYESIESFPFKAKHMLETAPRRIADLWQRLQDVVLAGPVASEVPAAKAVRAPKKMPQRATEVGEAPKEVNEPAKKVLDVLGAYCRAMISEDTSLTPASREHAHSRSVRNPQRLVADRFVPFRRTPRGGVGICRCRGLSSLDLDFAPQEAPTIRRSVCGDGLARLGAIPIRKPRRDLVAAAAGYNDHRIGDADPISGRAAPKGGVDSRLAGVRRRWSRQWWAITQWRSDYAARISIFWPVPAWSSYWEFDLFLGLWKCAIKSARDFADPNNVQDKLDFLIYSWMDCAALVFERKQVTRSTGKGPDATQWTELVKRLAAVLEEASVENQITTRSRGSGS